MVGKKQTKGAGKPIAKRSEAKAARPRQAAPQSPPGEVLLLSGGNPQIAKGYGDAPVQAYIAAMPDWKRDVGRRLDALIERAVPGVSKAVKRNSSWFAPKGRTARTA